MKETYMKSQIRWQQSPLSHRMRPMSVVNRETNDPSFALQIVCLFLNLCPQHLCSASHECTVLRQASLAGAMERLARETNVKPGTLARARNGCITPLCARASLVDAGRVRRHTQIAATVFC